MAAGRVGVSGVDVDAPRRLPATTRSRAATTVAVDATKGRGMSIASKKITARTALPAAVAGLLSLAASAALAADTTAAAPSPEQLMEQINALRAEVAQLKGAQAPATPTAAPAPAVDDALLRDADGRGLLMQSDSAFVAGYSKGKFLLQSADGKFVFHPSIQFQVRNATNYRDLGAGDDDEEIDNGWELRRVKLGFDGNALTKDLTYNFVWATSTSGSVSLEDAWVRYKFAPALGFRVGQFKAPLNHEGLVSSKKLLAADRTYFEGVLFNGDAYVQGVSLIYDDKGPLRAEVAFTDGYAENNANFQEPQNGGNDANFGFGGRAEYKVFGDWGAYEDFSALGAKQDTLVVGGGADITQNGDTNAIRYIADAQYEVTAGSLGGLGLFGQVGGLTTSEGGAGDDNTNWGFSVQAGYLITDRWEPFARYDFLSFEAAAPGFEDEVHEITVGVNYYFVGHNAKVTVDLNYLPNGAPTAQSGLDILQSGENQVVIRGQFQLLL